jgi:hypothetical protein
VTTPLQFQGDIRPPLRIELGRTCPNLGDEHEIILKKVHASKLKASNQMLPENALGIGTTVNTSERKIEGSPLPLSFQLE